jgi:heme exporter protein CcmD
MANFFAMGGHGTFIWLSYSIVFLTLVIIAIMSFVELRSLEAKLNKLKRNNKRGSKTTDTPEKNSTGKV